MSSDARPSQRVTICVFVKPPEPGRVKTRLAAEVGDRRAAHLAEAFFIDTCAGVGALRWARPVVAATAPLPDELAPAWPLWLQGEGDLGARIEQVLARAIGHAGAAIAIGADTPGLPRRLLEQARTALDGADAVLGPSADGGFYLLGLRRCPPGLLAGLPWSRPDTCAAVRARLEASGFTVATIAPWFDVDELADLRRLEGLIERGEVVAPATAAVLARPISIVMPVLDEERRLGAALARLRDAPAIGEVIVADGGSRDATAAIAQAAPGVRVVAGGRGRARQMNAGAAAARGEVLLFLHADVELPADAGAQIGRALAESRTVAGAFRTWTVPDGPTRLGPLLHLADLRSRYTHRPYGDQAIFVRAAAFARAGGYPEQPLMEEVELGRRLARLGRIRTVPARVRVSGRRFQARPVFYTLAVNVFPLLYGLGVPAATLARLYANVR